VRAGSEWDVAAGGWPRVENGLVQDWLKDDVRSWLELVHMCRKMQRRINRIDQTLLIPQPLDGCLKESQPIQWLR